MPIGRQAPAGSTSTVRYPRHLWNDGHDPLADDAEGWFRRFWARSHRSKPSSLYVDYAVAQRIRTFEGIEARRATDRKTGEEVFLELIDRSPASQVRQEEYARFRRDFEAIAALKHENILAPICERAIDGQRYIVRKCVDAASAGEVFTVSGATTDQVVNIVRQAAAAIAFAHSQGIHHLNVTPQSVLVEPNGHVWVADFGLVRDHVAFSGPRATSANLTAFGCLPPERLLFDMRRMGPQTDVYGLGALLYLGLTRKAPHAGRRAADVAASILGGAPKLAIPGDAPGVRGLEAVCARALRCRMPRFPDAAAFLQDLDRASRSALMTNDEPDPSARRARPTRFAWILGVVVALACGVAWHVPDANDLHTTRAMEVIAKAQRDGHPDDAAWMADQWLQVVTGELRSDLAEAWIGAEIERAVVQASARRPDRADAILEMATTRWKEEWKGQPARAEKLLSTGRARIDEVRGGTVDPAKGSVASVLQPADRRARLRDVNAKRLTYAFCAIALLAALVTSVSRRASEQIGLGAALTILGIAGQFVRADVPLAWLLDGVYAAVAAAGTYLVARALPSGGTRIPAFLFAAAAAVRFATELIGRPFETSLAFDLLMIAGSAMAAVLVVAGARVVPARRLLGWVAGVLAMALCVVVVRYRGLIPVGSLLASDGGDWPETAPYVWCVRIAALAIPALLVGFTFQALPYGGRSPAARPVIRSTARYGSALYRE